MRRAGRLVLYSLIYCMSLSVASQIWGVGRPSVALAMQDRYIVGYYRSQTRGNIQASTIVSITNQAPGSCEVSVVWFDLSNKSACRTTTNVGPLETHQHCSNALDPSIAECEVTCGEDPTSLSLDSHEGRAVVTINNGRNCLDNLIIDSRVYFTQPILENGVPNGFSQVSAIFSPRITLVPIGTSDLLGKGESTGVGNKGD